MKVDKRNEEGLQRREDKTKDDKKGNEDGIKDEKQMKN